MLAAAQGLPGAVSLQQAILFAQLEANEQQKASELSNRCCRGEPGSRLNTPSACRFQVPAVARPSQFSASTVAEGRLELQDPSPPRPVCGKRRLGGAC